MDNVSFLTRLVYADYMCLLSLSQKKEENKVCLEIGINKTKLFSLTGLRLRT